MVEVLPVVCVSLCHRDNNFGQMAYVSASRSGVRSLLALNRDSTQNPTPGRVGIVVGVNAVNNSHALVPFLSVRIAADNTWRCDSVAQSPGVYRFFVH